MAHGGVRGLAHRLAYGRPRRPLEPHAPLPWLLRAIAWALLGVTFAVFAVGLFAPRAQRSLALVFAITLGLSVVFFVLAAFRPTPVVLLPDEEG